MEKTKKTKQGVSNVKERRQRENEELSKITEELIDRMDSGNVMNDGFVPKMKLTRDKKSKRSRVLSLWDSLRSKEQTGISEYSDINSVFNGPHFEQIIQKSTGLTRREMSDENPGIHPIELKNSSIPDNSAPNTHLMDDTAILSISRDIESSAKISLEKKSTEVDENRKYVLDMNSLASFDPLAHKLDNNETIQKSPSMNQKKEHAPLKVPWEDLIKMIQMDKPVSSISKTAVLGSNHITSSPVLADGVLVNLENNDSSRTSATPVLDFTSAVCTGTVDAEQPRSIKKTSPMRFSEINKILGPLSTRPYSIKDGNTRRKMKKLIKYYKTRGVADSSSMGSYRTTRSSLKPRVFADSGLLLESDDSRDTSSASLENNFGASERILFNSEPRRGKQYRDALMDGDLRKIKPPPRRENRNLVSRVKSTMFGWFRKTSRSERVNDLDVEDESETPKLSDLEFKTPTGSNAESGSLQPAAPNPETPKIPKCKCLPTRKS